MDFTNIAGTYPKEGNKFRIRVLKSNFEIQPAGAGHSWLKGVNGEETVILEYDSIMLNRTKSEIYLKLVPFKPDEKLQIWKKFNDLAEVIQAASGENSTGNSAAIPPSFWEQQKMESLKVKFAGVDLVELCSNLKKAVAGDLSPSELTALVHELRDYLLAFPDDAYLKIPRIIRANQDLDQAVNVIVHALELAGHDQAQSALSDIISKKDFLNKTRLQAIVAAGDLAKPGHKIIDTMLNLISNKESRQPKSSVDYGDLSDTALLSLGRIGKLLKNSGEDERQKYVLGKILDLLHMSNDNSRKETCLLALGNLGDPIVIPKLQVFLQDPDENIRQAAEQALNMITSNDSHGKK